MNIIGQGRFIFVGGRGGIFGIFGSRLLSCGPKEVDGYKQTKRGGSSVFASAAAAHVGSSGLFGRFGAADIVHAQEETSRLSASQVSIMFLFIGSSRVQLA